MCTQACDQDSAFLSSGIPVSIQVYVMATLDSSSGDIEDQSRGSCSPPCTSPLASASEFGSALQVQPQDPPKSPCFYPYSPPPASFDTAGSTVLPPASPNVSLPPKVCSEDAANPPYPSAECYLMRPEVVALIAKGAPKSPPPKAPPKDSPKEPKLQATVVSKTTSHHVPLLHRESQIRALTPRFEIEGDQHIGFGGTVKIGEKTITTEVRWQSKKAAKEGLAANAVDIVKAMPLPKRKRLAAEGQGQGQENWVGMLYGAQLLFPSCVLSNFALYFPMYIHLSPLHKLSFCLNFFFFTNAVLFRPKQITTRPQYAIRVDQSFSNTPSAPRLPVPAQSPLTPFHSAPNQNRCSQTKKLLVPMLPRKQWST